MPARPPVFRRGQRRLLAPLTQLGEVFRAAGLYVSWPLRLVPRGSGMTLGIDLQAAAGRRFGRITAGPNTTDHSYSITFLQRNVVAHSWVVTSVTRKGWELNDNQTIGGTPNVEILTAPNSGHLLFQLQTCP